MPQGRYTARLTVRSSLGTQVLERSVWAAGFAITPSATKVAPGQSLTVRFVSDRAAGGPPDGHVQAAGTGRRQGGRVTRSRDGSYSARFKVRTGPAGAGSLKVAATDTAAGANSTTIAIAVGAR